MNEGYGVNCGQATLTNTISAQPTASFEFEITTLDAHSDTKLYGQLELYTLWAYEGKRRCVGRVGGK